MERNVEEKKKMFVYMNLLVFPNPLLHENEPMQDQNSPEEKESFSFAIS